MIIILHNVKTRKNSLSFHEKENILKRMINKGPHRAKHDTTAVCRQGKIEQVLYLHGSYESEG